MNLELVAFAAPSDELNNTLENLFECKLNGRNDSNPAVALVLTLAMIHGNISVDSLQQAVNFMKCFNNQRGNLHACLGSKFFDQFGVPLAEFDGESVFQLTSVKTSEEPLYITYAGDRYMIQAHHGSPLGAQYAEYFHPRTKVFMEPRTVVQSNPRQCASDHAFALRLAVEYRDVIAQCDDDAANALKIVEAAEAAEAADAEAARLEAVCIADHATAMLLAAEFQNAHDLEASDALFAASLGRL